MKNIFAIITLSILLAACGATKNEELGLDVEGLKSELKTKETALNTLKTEIDSLKNKIEKLDPEFGKKEIPVVELVELKRGEFNHFVEVQGTIEAGEEKMISSELPGKIVALRVKEGDYVTKGQLLASIDVENVENGIEELKKSMELATDLYERQKRLWDQKIGSEVQFLQAKNNKERLEKSLASAELSLKKAKIYAPMSGSVIHLMAKQGEITSPGIPILQMINTREVKLTADVPEVYVRNVKRNDFVEVKIPVLDIEKTIRVSRIGNVIDLNNRTFEVEVRLSNPTGELKPNLLAMLYINDYSAKDAVAVPLELVQQDLSGKHYIFTAEEQEGRYFVHKKMIQTGLVYDGLMEVLAGLEGNEKLVSIGSQYLADGEEITLNGIK